MPAPEIRHCILCEDIRLERRNLSSLMGVYGATPFVGMKVRHFHLPVGICFVFMGAPADGKYAINAEIRKQDGTPLDAEVEPKGFEFTFTPQMGGSILAFRFRVIFPSPATYSVVLLNAGTVLFADTFKIAGGKEEEFN